MLARHQLLHQWSVLEVANSTMRDCNMPCENGKLNCFIMGCRLGMVARWPTFGMLCHFFKWLDLHVGNLDSKTCSLKSATDWKLAKRKTLTTFPFPLETSDFVDVYGVMVQGVHAESMHKYSFRNLRGNFLSRRDLEPPHRLQVAWRKFEK